MSDQGIRTPEQIQADLAATRAQMSATVDELVQTLKPSTQIRRAGERAQEKMTQVRELSRSVAGRVREEAADTLDAAREGDRDAWMRVGAVAAAATAVVGLCVLRAARRRH